MLNMQDLNNLRVFLNRVELKGTEAMTLAELQIKIGGMIEAAQNGVEEPPPDPDED